MSLFIRVTFLKALIPLLRLWTYWLVLWNRLLQRDFTNFEFLWLVQTLVLNMILWDFIQLLFGYRPTVIIALVEGWKGLICPKNFQEFSLLIFAQLNSIITCAKIFETIPFQISELLHRFSLLHVFTIFAQIYFSITYQLLSPKLYARFRILRIFSRDWICDAFLASLFFMLVRTR